MQIKRVDLFPISLPYKTPFVTSYGTMTHKTAVIVQIETTDSVIGWGEASLDSFPGYDAETLIGGLHILKDYLIPLILGQSIITPTQVPGLIQAVRGNHFAKAGLEAAIWDAYARTHGVSLAQLLGSVVGEVPRQRVAVGVAVGIQPNIDATLRAAGDYLAAGYTRLKFKIKPGADVEILGEVRRAFPDVMLMADANSAYTLDDTPHLAQLDDLNLLMIEQPLAYNDLYEHSLLQARIQTPICLDESVKSAHDWQLARHINAGKILNLKPGRVGGLTEALRIYQIQRDACWVGGMLETGIGRAMLLALASLPGFVIPGDISATDRYFEQDIVDQRFILNTDGTLNVPQGDGLGVVFQPV
ncbi:MAG: o-succinylbenzoate synthase [Chloroflexi bacterium]|nr:MAG: o-succinylbenzoate synthase [Chloroflexota bacterium]